MRKIAQVCLVGWVVPNVEAGARTMILRYISDILSKSSELDEVVEL